MHRSLHRPCRSRLRSRRDAMQHVEHLWSPKRPHQPYHIHDNEGYKITYFSTYHWNNGNGVPGGGIVGHRSSDGKTYGPWQVNTTPGQGGVPNANWIATGNVDLPAGTFTVIDSDPSTWHRIQPPADGALRGYRPLSWPRLPWKSCPTNNRQVMIK